jgi:hypothetical protein
LLAASSLFRGFFFVFVVIIAPPHPCAIAHPLLPPAKSVEERVRKRFPGAVRVENPLLHRTIAQLEQSWVEVGGDKTQPRNFTKQQFYFWFIFCLLV